MTLPELRIAIAQRLLPIEDILPKAYRLTLIARHTEMDDADIVVSSDEMEPAIKAIQRLKENGPITHDH